MLLCLPCYCCCVAQGTIDPYADDDDDMWDGGNDEGKPEWLQKTILEREREKFESRMDATSDTDETQGAPSPPSYHIIHSYNLLSSDLC